MRILMQNHDQTLYSVIGLLAALRDELCGLANSVDYAEHSIAAFTKLIETFEKLAELAVPASDSPSGPLAPERSDGGGPQTRERPDMDCGIGQ